MTKTKNVLLGVTTTALTLVLAGCNSTNNYSSSNQYSNGSIPPQPTDASCRDWDWDSDDGLWECDDRTSGNYGHYYYGGSYYKSVNGLLNSSAGDSYRKNSPAFYNGNGTTSTSTYSNSGTTNNSNNSSSFSSTKSSSGFGSGSSSSGG